MAASISLSRHHGRKSERTRLADSQIWINPDCGLKTRKWDEVRPALVNMVEAARKLRADASEAGLRNARP